MAEIDDSIISGADVRKISDVNDATIDHAHSAVFNRRAIHRDNDARANDHFSAVAAVYDRRKHSQRLEKGLLLSKDHRKGTQAGGLCAKRACCPLSVSSRLESASSQSECTSAGRTGYQSLRSFAPRTGRARLRQASVACSVEICHPVIPSAVEESLAILFW